MHIKKVDKEEVRLRKTIGVKKDEYFLDGKHIMKTEVMNLLESAGFSRSNPYYVLQLGKVEGARDKISEQSTKMYDGVQDAHEKSKVLDKEFKDLTKEVQIREKKSIEKQRTEAMSGNSKAKNEAAEQLELLEKDIKESDHELGKIRPLCEKQMQEEKNITKGIMEQEKQLSTLYQKQGRATQFSNKAARDKWLQKEIDEYERVLSLNQMQERKLMDEFEQIKEVEKQDLNTKDLKEKASGLESFISSSRGGYNEYKTRRDELHKERKSLWQKESEINAEIERLKSEVVKAEKSLDHVTPGVDKEEVRLRKTIGVKKDEYFLDGKHIMKTEVMNLLESAGFSRSNPYYVLQLGKDIRRGLGSVTRIFREHKMMGVFCPLFELLDCDEKPFTAGEVTAGNSLFRVQNDDLSTKIIRQLNGQKGGRVTFIPLNRVWSPRATYPQSSDVLTLQKKLNFSHDFSPAFGFGQRRFYSESPPPFDRPQFLGGTRRAMVFASRNSKLCGKILSIAGCLAFCCSTYIENLKLEREGGMDHEALVRGIYDVAKEIR